jgi:hypothetical protein
MSITIRISSSGKYFRHTKAQGHILRVDTSFVGLKHDTSVSSDLVNIGKLYAITHKILERKQLY